MTSVVDLAKLSDAVYSDQVKVGQWLRVGLPFTEQNSGYKSALFQHMTTTDYALAIAGTNPTELDDLKSDLNIAMGSVPAQYRVARSAYFAATGITGDFSGLYLTGHSLGGGLVSMLGKEYGDPTVTFNAPGMARSFGALTRLEPGVSAIDDDERKVIHVCAMFDIISRGSGAHMGSAKKVDRVYTKPVGAKEVAFGVVGALLTGNVLVGGAVTAGMSSLKAHSITRLIPVLEKHEKYREPLGWV
jgi:hypothetical protein